VVKIELMNNIAISVPTCARQNIVNFSLANNDKCRIFDTLINDDLCQLNIHTQNTPVRVDAMPAFGFVVDKPSTPQVVSFMEYSTTQIRDQKSPKNDFGCIYMIHNKITKKSYIGQSYNFFQRMNLHITQSMRGRGLYVDTQIGSYLDNVVFIILKTYEELGVTHWNRKIRTVVEHKYITEFNTKFPYGYNIKHYESVRIK
jgi:GIY-YIG catalytic domain